MVGRYHTDTHPEHISNNYSIWYESIRLIYTRKLDNLSPTTFWGHWSVPSKYIQCRYYWRFQYIFQPVGLSIWWYRWFVLCDVLAMEKLSLCFNLYLFNLFDSPFCLSGPSIWLHSLPSNLNVHCRSRHTEIVLHMIIVRSPLAKVSFAINDHCYDVQMQYIVGWWLYWYLLFLAAAGVPHIGGKEAWLLLVLSA